MIGIQKFSKISMVVGLLLASASWVHAMDEDEEFTAALLASLEQQKEEEQLQQAIAESVVPAPQQNLPSSTEFFKGMSYLELDSFVEVLERNQWVKNDARNNPFITPPEEDGDEMERQAIALSLTSVQEARKELPPEHVYCEEPIEDIIAFIAAQDRLDEQLKAKTRIQAHGGQVDPIFRVYAPGAGELSHEQWGVIAQQIEPGVRVAKVQEENKWKPGPEGNAYLRADHIPTALKDGTKANAPTQGLGDLVRALHGTAGAQVWQNNADKKELQREQRRVVTPAVPQPTQAELDAQEALQQLNGLKKKVLPPHQPEPEEMQEPTSVRGIAGAFGGQGGYRKSPEKK